MAAGRKTKQVAEFGDFQTPLALAKKVCAVLARRGVRPRAIIEPTCGRGSFLLAAIEAFPTVSRAIGLDVNPSHIASARTTLEKKGHGTTCDLMQGDFFEVDWPRLLAVLPEPLLVVGNPPWVTNAALGALGSSNLPEKSNFQKRGGLDAITGKANFDISEWMIIRLLEWLDGRVATLAMLCKTAVARKALYHAWKRDLRLEDCSLHQIDAQRHFGAAVDACLLLCRLTPSGRTYDCRVHEKLGDPRASRVLGYREGRILADVGTYDRLKHLQGQGRYRWRSGIKHDCGKVMELRREGKFYRNGLGQLVELEPDYLYPMLKSSQVANGSMAAPRRWMLVTQKTVGEDTNTIRARAPKTWQCLTAHAQPLQRRASSIYRKRPTFSVFGVGDYSFAPWKVATSGFYKRLHFAVVGSFEGKPIVLDDTCYFIPCQTKEEADLIAGLLNSGTANEFYSALIFWDSKRPITVDVLQQLRLEALASHVHIDEDLAAFAETKPARSSRDTQLALFEGA